jgi:hypothetical protein
MSKKGCSLGLDYCSTIAKSIRKTKSFTIKDMIKLDLYCRMKAIIPDTIKDKKEAERMNRFERAWARIFRTTLKIWKVGEEYYTLVVPSLKMVPKVKPNNFLICKAGSQFDLINRSRQNMERLIKEQVNGNNKL